MRGIFENRNSYCNWKFKKYFNNIDLVFYVILYIILVIGRLI